MCEPVFGRDIGKEVDVVARCRMAEADLAESVNGERGGRTQIEQKLSVLLG